MNKTVPFTQKLSFLLTFCLLTFVPAKAGWPPLSPAVVRKAENLMNRGGREKNGGGTFTRQEADFLLNLGQELLERRMPGEARRIFLSLSASNCLSARVLCGLGATYIGEVEEAGDCAAAEKYLHQALKLDPACGLAYSYLAELDLKRDRPASALQLADRGLQCKQPEPLCYLYKADALVNLGRLKEAYAIILRAEKELKPMALVFNTKGGILEQMGRPYEAAQAFRRSSELAANDWTFTQLINCLREAKHYDEALSEVQKLLRASPKDADVYRLRSTIYSSMKNYELAIKDMNTAIKLEPTSLAYKERARLYQLSGNSLQAQSDLQAAQKIRDDGF